MEDKEKKKPSTENIDKLISSVDIPGFPNNVKELFSEKIKQITKSNESKDELDLLLDEDEMKELSLLLAPYIVDILRKIETDKLSNKSKEVVCYDTLIKLLTMVVDNHPEKYQCSDEWHQIFAVINKNLQSNFLNFKTRDSMCALCEKCCLKQFNISGNFILETLKFLFDHTLDEKKQVPLKDLKRILNLQEIIYKLNVDGVVFQQLSQRFLKSVSSPFYLNSKYGKQLISLFFILDPKLTVKLHKAVKLFLPFAAKAQATAFGKIYHEAWLNSEGEKREVIEKQCIQDFMSRIFTLHRSAGFMEMSKLGNNVLAILSYFHANRKLVKLSKVLTDLYKPLIWRHLRSGSSIIRCNAAEVFLDVYPLEKPGVGREEQAEFLQRQHNEMADLLTDSCHIVRIVGVKGICNCLKEVWDTFSPESIKKLMEIMVNDMINDCSSYKVRIAVYQGFSKMLQSPVSGAYISKVLPDLKEYIHDENEKVRHAFVSMLIQLNKSKGIVPIRYWDVVSLAHLAARLQLDNEEVGKSLVKLMINEIIEQEKPVSNSLKRIYKLMIVNHEAVTKLFSYSKKIVPLPIALDIMLNILKVLLSRIRELKNVAAESVKGKGSANGEVQVNRKKKKMAESNDSNDSSSSLEVSSSSTSSDTSIVSSNEEVNEENAPKEKHQLDDPGVCYVFIDIVIILWTINLSDLNEPENKENLRKLQTIASNCIPVFLKHFKDTEVFYAVVHLASLVPITKLTPVSTVSSMCISRLKDLHESCPKKETEVYVGALCSWNRAPEILELATDWLDEAFRSERLNQSAAVKRQSTRTRKVKFQHGEAKPLLALKIIDIIFEREINRLQIMKNYNALYEFFVYLERIKMLIEKRFELGEPFPDVQLSDEFLEKCLYRYAKLIVELNKKEEDVNDTSSCSTASDTSNTQCSNSKVNALRIYPSLVDWSFRVIIDHIPASYDYSNEDIPISVTLMKAIVRADCLMVCANYMDEFNAYNFIALLDHLLKSGCSLAFVDIALTALRKIVINTETYIDRDKYREELMRKELPNLLNNIILILNNSSITKDIFLSHITNLNEAKNCLLSLPVALLNVFGAKSPILKRVLISLTECAIRIISDKILEVDSLIKVDKIQNLPYCSYFIVGSLLSRQNINNVWMKYLPDCLSSFSCDPLKLSGAVSLLHSLSFVKKPKAKEMLVESVKKAHEIMKSLQENSDKSRCQQKEHNESTVNNEQIEDEGSIKLIKTLDLNTVLTETASRLGTTLI